MEIPFYSDRYGLRELPHAFGPLDSRLHQGRQPDQFKVVRLLGFVDATHALGVFGIAVRHMLAPGRLYKRVTAGIGSADSAQLLGQGLTVN